MANVRQVFAITGGRLVLGGSGAGLYGGAGMSLVWVGTVQDGTSPSAIFGLINGSANTIAVIYHQTSGGISFGSSGGDVTSGVAVPATLTDLVKYAVTVTAAGSVVIHTKNLTTGSASTHTSAGTVTPVTGTWDKTEVSGADNYNFQGDKHHGVAAVLDYIITNGQFDGITDAQSLYDLTPIRMWRFNQASTATDIINEMTGSADETSDISTSVVNNSSFDSFDFTITPGGAPPVGRSRSRPVIAT